MVIGARLSVAVISRKMVISISNRALKANDLNALSEFGFHVTLTDNCAKGILQSIDWVKCKEATGKIKPSPQHVAKERFTFQISIATCL